MRDFTDLFEELDSTTSTNEKVDALKKYFKKAKPADAMWAVLMLTGKSSKRVVTSRDLRVLFLLATDYPEWLYDECYHHVGDTAETLALLAHSLELCRETPSKKTVLLSKWMDEEIPALAKIKDEKEQADKLMSWWRELTYQEVFVLNKLITGAFRVGVSEKLVIRALAEVYELPTDQVAHRLTGDVKPGADTFAQVISAEPTELNFSQPYPFCLAHPWTERSERDFNAEDWCIEWKYDGIRAQVIRRENQIWIWSRGEEQITQTFPDVAKLLEKLPVGTVLDGEIVVFKDNKILAFQELQKRLGRKKVTPAQVKERPAGFLVYDCLEFDGQDLRQRPLRERKEFIGKSLEHIKSPQVKESVIIDVKDLDELMKLREESRDHDSEGLMIKLWNGPYSVGRKTGNWWKFKVDPLTLDAVLLYAQAGSGRRSNLYTDYTFAIWDEEHKLIPFAKAYSGLDQKEIDELDNWIRRHTIEKFGPVRSVKPEHVFEIGFEGIGPSTRHKSGIAVRFPRILRWRRDKKPDDADSIKSARQLLDALGVSSELPAKKEKAKNKTESKSKSGKPLKPRAKDEEAAS
jgi:ATP-dependent DNA ligase